MNLVKQYDLPDIDILQDNASLQSYLVWQPKNTCIVLGRSNNNLEESVFVDAVKRDNVDVYQRQTGGQAVVLSPQMLAISISESREQQLASKEHFAIYNNIIIAALKKLGVENLSQKGISDITIHEKKIAGTAMYRNKNKVFYHAILNICENLDIFGLYLKYPTKVPDYRQGRKHSDFITSLKIQGYHFSIDATKAALEKELQQHFAI